MNEQKHACMFRLASSEQNSDSQTWTASIDAMRNYRGRDEWHLSAIEFHHKDRKEAEKLRDEWLAARCSAVSDGVPRSEMLEALANQRRRMGAEYDTLYAELKRVREVARAEIERLSAVPQTAQTKETASVPSHIEEAINLRTAGEIEAERLARKAALRSQAESAK